MKRILNRLAIPTRVSLALGILMGVTASVQAVIPVTLSGAPADPFTTAPAATEWSTFDTLVGAAGTYVTPAALDAAAVLLDSTTFTTALGTTAANGTARLARHNTVGTFLVTQPTGVPYAVLMARLRNTSGGGVSSITVSYNYTIPVAPVTDEIPGQRVFYSQTGLPSSWTPIPNFSGIIAAGSLSATLALGSWPDNGDLFIMFLDDNNLTGADGAFAIDNFAVSGVVPLNLTAITITNSPANLTVGERSPASFTVVAGGSPRDYYWFSNTIPVPGNNSQTFTIPSAASPGNDAAQIYVVVSNSLGGVTSSTATLTVTPDSAAPAIVRVLGNPDQTTVTITFSEAILATGVDPANFTLFPTGSDPDFDYLLTTGAVLSNPSNVVITTDPRIVGTNYSIRIQEIRDNSSAQNVIDPNPTDLPLITQNLLLVDFDVNNIWKFGTLSNGVAGPTYNPDTEFSIPVGWQTVAYDDSLWPEGPAGLGLDASVNGVPVRTPTGYSARSEPTFFRRHFTLPSGTNGLVLNMRHVFEDGAIIFLNGVETMRINVGAATVLNNVARATGAAVDPTPISAPVTLPLSNVFGGDNVIAVMVLQSGGTSSDIEMAIELTASIPEYPTGPVIITTQPAALTTVNEGQGFTLSVTASGAVPITYQWRKGGIDIPGANGPSYGILATVPSDDGTFSVAVSNALGGLISANAVVDVIDDVTGPAFLSAVADITLTNILLTFGELLNQSSAETPGNYSVHLTAGGGNLTIESATLVGGTTVRLVTSPRTQSQNYTIDLSGVIDTAVNENPATPSSRSVVCEISVFGFAQVWRYEETGANLGTAWRGVSFNDSAWPSGAGFLGFEDSVNVLTLFTNLAGGNGTNTVLSLTNNTGGGIGGTNVTIYFRTTVSLPFDPTLPGNTLFARSYIDDGAAIYVNGAEQMRFNLTNTANYTNFAIAGSTEATLVTSNLAGFVQANNIIAAEVHQSALNSSDIDWGMELRGLVTTFAAVGPTVHVAYNLDGSVTVSWTGSGTLQCATAIEGGGLTVWAPVLGNPNPYTFTPLPGTPVKFFSLAP